MNAQQVVPDIIFANWGLDPLVELDMIEPLDDLIAKHQYDINQLDPSLVASIRAMDKEKGELWVSRYNTVRTGFAIPRKCSTIRDRISCRSNDVGRSNRVGEANDRERDGIQYRGLEMGPGLASSEVTVPLSQLAVNLTDPETGRCSLRKNLPSRNIWS
ncbi:hypothetical protein M3650_07835 [Paenibacillus sp. MER TA 81-3]|uniref:hypothetical protein n=1 Tax=Paenibacillus sp. MER TA 81-3 TaxID=2939573 RepID=UPI00203C029A|nr:hypothetical protein [Paenibacillus sp. MER TA 81-3]MCM3338544.1 hypothetical protein [Paenibacillus sp. MER TA 81-3]